MPTAADYLTADILREGVIHGLHTGCRERHGYFSDEPFLVHIRSNAGDRRHETVNILALQNQVPRADRRLNMWRDRAEGERDTVEDGRRGSECGKRVGEWHGEDVTLHLVDLRCRTLPSFLPRLLHQPATTWSARPTVTVSGPSVSIEFDQWAEGRHNVDSFAEESRRLEREKQWNPMKP